MFAPGSVAAQLGNCVGKVERPASHSSYRRQFEGIEGSLLHPARERVGDRWPIRTTRLSCSQPFEFGEEARYETAALSARSMVALPGR